MNINMKALQMVSNNSYDQAGTRERKGSEKKHFSITSDLFL